MASWITTLALLAFPGLAFAQTPLVSGNGLGYAVVQPITGAVKKFYAHPYRFERINPDSEKGDGVETASFISRAVWVHSAGVDSPAFTTSYVNESQVIRADNGILTEYFYLPFGLEHNVLVTGAVPRSSGAACLNVTWQHPLLSKTTVHASGLKFNLLHFQGAVEVLAAVPIGNESVNLDHDKMCAQGWAFIVLESDKDAPQAVSDFSKWRNGDDIQKLVNREVRTLDDWRVVPNVHFYSTDERKLWRQNETILRMAQIREVNRPGRRSQGLINASLPDGEWFIPWVRDMSFSIVGLTRMGHQSEARNALTGYYSAGPMGRMKDQLRGNDYQISTVRYFGDGTEDADYSGAPFQNLELDSWGLALWATGQYFAQFRDVAWLNSPAAQGSVYLTARDFVVKPLLANLDPYGAGAIVTADSSIWEQNYTQRMHYAYSTIAAIAGLKSFLSVAIAMGDFATKAAIEKNVDQLERGFFDAYIVNHSLRGTIEPSPRNDMDGALLEAINTGLVTDPEIVDSTINRMDLLKTGSGGYRRVRGDTEYEAHEFVFIDFMLARVYLRQHLLENAEALFQPIVKRALADNGFIPEMYVSQPSEQYPGSVGSPAGAVPMAGYGAGAYMIYMSERNSLSQTLEKVSEAR